ncbi:hypothetical protein Rsub_02417 [Raphidocelis subcapitata]|uniref:Uncharacterized protein n=1 Tax=Raphidocelis subcapitata TaxID=307507 RepID=A0A2V0NRQ9_9CHLO|nr:hypothetical protein Rsub_02417 [Raphidocelis subcapitata]|eukprot:GBF90311.1 hypothetical protein Rsub_02417 [Raphidocelis subcapitata]
MQPAGACSRAASLLSAAAFARLQAQQLNPCQQQRGYTGGRASAGGAAEQLQCSGSTSPGAPAAEASASAEQPFACHSPSEPSGAGAGGWLGAAAAGAAAPHAAPHAELHPWLDPGASALDALHAATGLPWWAAIPLTTLAAKAALLPLSVRQARIVRSNMALWNESFELSKQRDAKEAAAARQRAELAAAAAFATQQQDRQAPGNAPAAAADGALAGPRPDEPPAALGTAHDGLLQLLRWRRRVSLFHELRVKCGVPHPAWFLANNLVQWPVFVYLGVCVRSMAQLQPPWPGFQDGGALWFRDLTLPAVAAAAAGPGAAAAAAGGGGGLALPMGAAGLALPLAVTGLMLASIRIGFKVSGAAARHPAVAGTFLQPLLRYAPAALYALTLGSLYLKLQLPQAVLLHWLASSGFTLSLQLALRRSALRAALGFGGPAAGGGGGGGGVDAAVEARAAAAGGADVLVAVAAKASALHRYDEAKYCLARAAELEPGNAGVHYAAAQVAALTGDWPAAEAAYSRCAEAAAAAGSGGADYRRFVGQALFCAGTARARQGRHPEALASYAAAEAAGYAQPHALAQARGAALLAMGRPGEAAAVVQDALRAGRGSGGGGGGGDGFVDMTPVLRDLLSKIEERQTGGQQ